MNRNEFVGDQKLERIKDPEIKPKQRWRAIRQHDFGNGLVDYFIDIAFKDPMSNLWTCNYAWVNHLIPHTSSLYVAKLTTEEITKNFEIAIAVATPIQPAPIYQPIVYPLMPAQPQFQNNPIYRDINQINNGFQNDVFFNTTIGSTDLIPNGSMETSSNFEASLSAEGLASRGFNFSNHIQSPPSI